VLCAFIAVAGYNFEAGDLIIGADSSATPCHLVIIEE